MCILKCITRGRGKVAETRHVMCSEFDVGVGLTCRKIIYLMVSFKRVLRHHLFSFSKKPHLMVNEAFFSIDCRSADGLTMPYLCLGSRAVVICSNDHWALSFKLLNYLTTNRWCSISLLSFALFTLSLLCRRIRSRWKCLRLSVEKLCTNFFPMCLCPMSRYAS